MAKPTTGCAGVAPSPDTITTSCLLCAKPITWHCDGRHVFDSAHDYCSTWCRQGHEFMKAIHAALKAGRERIDQADEDAEHDLEMMARDGEDAAPYYSDHAIEHAIAGNIKELVTLTYDGIRRLDNLKFYEWA